MVKLLTFTRLVTASVVICAATMAIAQSDLPSPHDNHPCSKVHCATAKIAEVHALKGRKHSPAVNDTVPTFHATHSNVKSTKEEKGIVTVTSTGPSGPHPTIVHDILSSDNIFTVYTKPLYTTAIRLPGAVTSIAVGAPTLFKVEHAKAQPRLVFVKPSTHAPANSDLIIALGNGSVVSIHLISPGDVTSKEPVDFFVDYTRPHSLVLATLNGPGTAGLLPATSPIAVHLHSPSDEATSHSKTSSGKVSGRSSTSKRSGTAAPATSVFSGGTSVESESPLESYLVAQEHIAAPAYIDGHDLARVYPIDKYATDRIGVAFGKMSQSGDRMTFAYSVLNLTHKWIEVLPPEIQFEDPGKKRHSRKHPKVLAETIPIDNYLVSARKVAPGGRIDGVVRFDRPSFKSQKEKLMLQLALADRINKAILIPLPFVVAGPHSKESHGANRR